jgi:hypothetical protein
MAVRRFGGESSRGLDGLMDLVDLGAKLKRFDSR